MRRELGVSAPAPSTPPTPAATAWPADRAARAEAAVRRFQVVRNGRVPAMPMTAEMTTMVQQQQKALGNLLTTMGDLQDLRLTGVVGDRTYFVARHAAGSYVWGSDVNAQGQVSGINFKPLGAPVGTPVFQATGDVATGRRLSLMSAAKGSTHSFPAGKMKVYRLTLTSADDVMLRVFLGPAANKTPVLAFADSRSVNTIHFKVAEASALRFFVTGVKGKGRYSLTVEELPENAETNDYLLRRQAEFAQTSGRMFFDGSKNIAIEDLSAGGKSIIRRLAPDGRMFRVFEYAANNPKGSSWQYDNQAEWQRRYADPATMHTTFDSITVMTTALGTYDILYVMTVDEATGDLLVTTQTDYRPFEVYRLKRQTPAETQAFRTQYASAVQSRQRQQQAAQSEPGLLGAVMQGVAMGVVAGYTGTEVPSLNADGSAPNMLETLNAAGAVAAQREAQSRASLNATIADAQAQAERQRQAEAAQAERQRQAAAQARAQPQPAAPVPVRAATVAPKPAAAPPSLKAQIADTLGEGGTGVRKKPPEPDLESRLPAGQKMCPVPASSREWTTDGLMEMSAVQKEYNALKTNSCKGGSASVGPIQCSNVISSFDLRVVSCKATISCPSYSVPCTAAVSRE